MKNNVINVCDRRFGEKCYLLLGMCAVSALFVSLFSYSTSPFYFHDGYDSCVFQTMGLALLQGKIPYVDLFDHKGPILYFIDALGIWIGDGKIGIYILQILANTVSFIFIYKTIRLFLNVIPTLCVFTGSLLLYAYFYGEGNLCEEWMLCFISPALFLALRNIISTPNISTLLYDSAFYGFCLAMCFLIRPNDAVIHIGGVMFGTFLWMISRKEYKQAWLNVVIMGASFAVCVLPSICFYAYHNALPDLWYGLIMYNSQYASEGSSIFLSILSLIRMMIFVPLLIIAILAGIRKERTILYVLIAQILLAWLLLGARMYRHYWICLIPLFSLFGIAGMYWKKISACILSIGLVVVLMAVVLKKEIFISGYQKAKEIAETYVYKQKLVYDFYAESEKIFSFVPKEEQNQIWNYNLGWCVKPYFSVFYHHGIVQCNKIPFYPMVCEDVELRKFDDIRNKCPQWVMLSRDEENSYWLLDDWQKSDYEFIKTNYECVAMTNPDICEIELWKKRDE